MAVSITGSVSPQAVEGDNNFVMFRASDLTINGTVTDAGDITGAALVLGARKDLLGTGLDIEKAGAVNVGADGTFTVDLDPADTEELLGTYHYDVRMFLGGEYATIIRAVLTVLEVVTPPV